MSGVLLNRAQCVSGKQTHEPCAMVMLQSQCQCFCRSMWESASAHVAVRSSKEGIKCCNPAQITLLDCSAPLWGAGNAHMIRDCASSEGEIQLLAGDQWFSKTLWHHHAYHICHTDNFLSPLIKPICFFRPIPVFPTEFWLSMRYHKPLKWFSDITVHEGWIPLCCSSKNNASPVLAEIKLIRSYRSNRYLIDTPLLSTCL